MDLKERMYEKRIKQRDLAIQLNVDPSQISCWLNHLKKIPKKHWSKLSQLLDCSEEGIEQHMYPNLNKNH